MPRDWVRRAFHLLRQAEIACDPDQRLAVIRRMYQVRFPGELDPGLTLEQIRRTERLSGAQYLLPGRKKIWDSLAPDRFYDRGNWNNSDPINRALSAANALLNGLCHAGIVSGGYSPGSDLSIQGSSYPSCMTLLIFIKLRLQFHLLSRLWQSRKIKLKHVFISPAGKSSRKLAY